MSEGCGCKIKRTAVPVIAPGVKAVADYIDSIELDRSQCRFESAIDQYDNLADSCRHRIKELEAANASLTADLAASRHAVGNLHDELDRLKRQLSALQAGLTGEDRK